MRPDALRRLAALAEEARKAAEIESRTLHARIEALEAEDRRLRARAASIYPADRADAADRLVALRWAAALREDGAAAAAAANALAEEARAARARHAEAEGRASVLGEMWDRQRAETLRLRELRADLDAPPRRGGGQRSSPSGSAGASSDGMR